MDQPNEQLVELLVREEVARHVTAMYTLERIDAQEWGLTRTLMASINQVCYSLKFALPFATSFCSLADCHMRANCSHVSA